MRLIFHGQLRELYGKGVEMFSDTVADALEGFFSQQPDHPRDMLVEAVGFDTEEKLFATTTQKEVHIIPAMYGGGGKFFNILIGAVLVVAGVLISGPLGIALIINGGLMILQGIVSLFMKAPTASKSEDPPASKYLGVNRNTTQHGTPIIFALGTIAIGGHWLSLQSDADKLTLTNFPANPV